MKTTPPTSSRAFTTTELLVAISLIAVLAVLLITSTGTLRKKTQLTHCLANLKQISAASAAYGIDHQGQFPPNRVNQDIGNRVFILALIPYLGNIPARPSEQIARSPLVCPASILLSKPDSSARWKGVYTPGLYGLSYAQNYELTGPVADRWGVGLTRRSAVELPSQLMLYIDYQNHYIANRSQINKDKIFEDPDFRARHNDSVNVAYADGSVRTLPFTLIPSSTTDPFWIGRELQ